MSADPRVETIRDWVDHSGAPNYVVAGKPTPMRHDVRAALDSLAADLEASGKEAFDLQCRLTQVSMKNDVLMDDLARHAQTVEALEQAWVWVTDETPDFIPQERLWMIRGVIYDAVHAALADDTDSQQERA